MGLFERIMTNLKITSYTADDPVYKQACVLREQVLRTPLGMVLREQDKEQDRCSNMYHFAAVSEQGCVGSVSLYVQEQGAELRQMCVAPDCHGQGVGAKLVVFAEQVMVAQGVIQVKMHARVSAQSFYQRLGYVANSNAHDHLGIAHVWMCRLLSK